MPVLPTMRKNILLSLLVLLLLGLLFWQNQKESKTDDNQYTNSAKLVLKTPIPTELSLVVLGTTQDAGSPQIGCKKACCAALFDQPDPSRKVVSLGIVDPKNGKNYLFEATPDIPTQVRHLHQYTANKKKEIPDGIFLTHAHIGHYTGLMHLGKEATNAQGVPVYAMPKMREYLTQNGPWSQLVETNNIALQPLRNQVPIQLEGGLQVRPFQVPHRDEFSETVGYHIAGKRKTALFIPDIDKWEKWGEDILKAIQSVDYAFLDATFYDNEELGNRDMASIPHPFVVESMKQFSTLNPAERAKVYFIHFNHTNPLLNSTSEQFKTVKSKGFNVAQLGQVFNL